MATIVIWAGAALAYLAFRLWYDGIRKPLGPDEIEEYCRALEERVEDDGGQHDLAVLRKFMEEDDGKEFLMVNLLEFNPSPVTHPDTGQGVAANALLLEYFRPLMKMFLHRAGHPVMTLRARGGYIDAWNTPADPGWHVAGLVRYRSRRDAMDATLASAAFREIHRYKVAALKQTFAFPSQVQTSLYPSPRITVALVLALGAALLQLAFS